MQALTNWRTTAGGVIALLLVAAEMLGIHVPGVEDEKLSAIAIAAAAGGLLAASDAIRRRRE